MKNILSIKFQRIVAGIFTIIVCPIICVAQAPALSASQTETSELFPSKFSGETTEPLANLWDGVDDQNNICTPTCSYWILNDAGKMVEIKFPPSPNFVDINDDGLNDLVVGDSYGFIWVYLNSGEKGHPKFTTGTFIHTFTGWASRTHITDWDQDGDYDAIIGTFYGNIVFMKNMGTRKHYKFIQKMGIPRYVDPRHKIDSPNTPLPSIMLGKSPMILGNYIAPWVTDWNKDNKPDLIAGEGSYSANSVRFALNVGPRGKPTFVQDRLFFLAYGEGFEQLTPCVVDYNGDGINDLIVGTRTGHIRLYKGTAEAVEGKDMVAAIRSSLSPAVLEFDKFLKIAGKSVFDVMSIVYPCDWNEDGLFDLLVGSTSGKIYITLNQGTKTEPKFPKIQIIKGTNVYKDLIAPSGWQSSIGLIWPGWRSRLQGICNAARLFSAEKEVILKPGTPPIRPVAGDRFMYFRYMSSIKTDDKAGEGFFRPKKNYIGWVPFSPSSSSYSYDTSKCVRGARTIVIDGYPLKMIIGKRYQFSFSSVLQGKGASWAMWALEVVKPGTAVKPPQRKWHSVTDNVSPSSSWQKRSHTFKCPGVHKTNSLNFMLEFSLPDGDCKFMIDDFSLKQVGR